MKLAVALVAIVGLAAASTSALADKLDDIQSAKVLRCGVSLDFPPLGYRDADNNPVGYDVEYCHDMAKALGVTAEVVETPSADRIPALLSDRVDVSIAGASITLERAKVISFSIPYALFEDAILVKKDSPIQSFEDLKGKSIGLTRGGSPESYFMPYYKAWNDPKGAYTGYGSNGELFLALSQGKVDAIIETGTLLGQYVKTPQGQEFRICCKTPFPQDWTGIMVNRQDTGLLNWINVFVWQQVRSGRTEELYQKYIGISAPSFALPNVYY